MWTLTPPIIHILHILPPTDGPARTLVWRSWMRRKDRTKGTSQWWVDLNSFDRGGWA